MFFLYVIRHVYARMYDFYSKSVFLHDKGPILTDVDVAIFLLYS